MHLHSLEEFEKSPIWLEITTFLSDIKGKIQEELQTFDPFQQPTEIARGQGKIWMIDTIVGDLMRDIRYDITNKMEETRDGSE